MLKKLVFIVSVIFIFSAVAIAQEKPETEKKDKQECSKDSKCCSMKGEETSSLSGESPKEAFNKLCPVMGNKVDPEVPTIEFEGKAYGFCCAGCDDKFRNDPEKFSKNLNEDGTKFIGKKSRH